MPAETVLESALRRDRLIVTVALIAVTLVAWAYVLAGAGTGMSPIAMSRIQPESMSEAAPARWTAIEWPWVRRHQEWPPCPA